MNIFSKYLILAIIALIFTACGKKSEPKSEVLVKVGNAVLTRADLDSGMPAGLTADDSVRYAQAFIRTWIDNKLVGQIAAEEIDMTEVNKMVDAYRNELIMWEYCRQMFDSHVTDSIDEDSLKSFYKANREEFKLTRPMVKGIYLKVPDDSPSLPTLRRLYRSSKQSDIENLEKSELNSAVHYDYFRDRWIDWEQIESRIPYDFGSAGADAFLRSHHNIDTSLGGFTYLLDITDVLPSGSYMPFEAARPLIIDRLNYRRRRNYETTLRRELYDTAVASGKVKINVEI